MDRQSFREKYDIAQEDLDAFEAQTAIDPRKKKIVIGAVIFALILAATMLLRINQAVPEVTASIARENITAFETTAKQRMGEARVLTSRLFDVVATLLEDNPPFQRMKKHWGDATLQMNKLQTDVGLLDDQPIEASKRLVSDGPARIRAIVKYTGAAVDEIQTFLPQMLASLQNAKETFSENDAGGITPLLAALDKLFTPLIGGDPALQASWDQLRDDFTTWFDGVQADVATLRERIQGDQMSREFASRLFSAVLGF